MNPQTKSHLESRIRLLLAGAQRQCDEAHEHEDQARYLRAAAERDRIVASDIQALIDGAPLPVGELPTTTGEGYREVQHVDTDEPESTGIPPHVWLYRIMLTEQQAVAPLGRDETNGQYAVAIDDLTDAQRAIPHVATQLARMFNADAIAAEEADLLAVEGEVAENEILRRGA